MTMLNRPPGSFANESTPAFTGSTLLLEIPGNIMFIAQSRALLELTLFVLSQVGIVLHDIVAGSEKKPASPVGLIAHGFGEDSKPAQPIREGERKGVVAHAVIGSRYGVDDGFRTRDLRIHNPAL